IPASNKRDTCIRFPLGLAEIISPRCYLTVGDKSPLHSLTPKKANRRRKVARTPVYINHLKRPYNSPMRRRIAHVAILTVASLLAGESHIRAQDCTARLAPTSDARHESGPAISIVEVTFWGSLQLPIS